MVAPRMLPPSPFQQAPPGLGLPPPQMPPMGMPTPMPGMDAMGPMTPPMEQPPPTVDPVALLDALRQLVPQQKEHKPRYPAGYKQPPRPEPAKIKSTADKLFNQHDMWRNLISITTAWLRQERVGMFPEDGEDRKSGLQEEYISTALTDKRNDVISKVASAQMGVRKRVSDDKNRRRGQLIEDAIVHISEEMEYAHVQAGNRPLKIDEAQQFTDRGMFVSRQVLNPNYDPERPIIVDLIEPTQVYPVWAGKNGLRAVYRVYRDTYANLQAAYGDIDPESRKKIEKKIGKELGDDTEVNVYEYWDTWWRCVLIDDQPILPVTAHKYGYVPWTIQYGGYGDPMFSRTPGQWENRNGTEYFDMMDKTRADERVYKAVPLIWYDMRSHEIYEAVMARLLTGFKKEINPPTIRYRSNMADGDFPEFSTAAGAVNEAILGEERIEPVPQQTNNPVTGVILQNLMGDRMARTTSFSGQADKSNVTGSALLRIGDENTDKILPIYQSLQMAKTQQFTQILWTLRNFNHLIKYGGDEPTPLMIPARRPRQGESPAFELSPELIDAVGTRVEITFTKVNPADWVGLFNAGKLGVDAGFVSRGEIRKLATGDSDYDRFQEEYFEEQMLFAMAQNPKYQELFGIEAAIADQIKESQGDPEMVEYWLKKLDEWKQLGMQQQQPPMDPMAAMQGGGMGQMQPPPPPPGSQVIPPPTPGGVSMPSLGVGPGSQGAPVGRPPMM